MKSVKRRATALLASSALALGGIFAIAQPSFATQISPVVVTFWESHSASNQQGEALAHIVRVFEHQHPNIRIVVHVTTASAKALAAVQAGDPPVMAMIGHGPQYGYEQAGALVNLKPLIYGKNGFPAAQLKGIWPGVWKAEFTPKGQQYLFPVDIKVAEFFYNANLWKKAGLKKTPATWGQLLQDAQVIQRKTGAMGLGARLDRNDWSPLFYSNGGHFFVPGHPTQLDLNSPAMATTIRQLVARDNAYGVHILSYNTSFEDFAAGKLGILENTADGYEMVREGVANKFPVGVFPVPPGTTGKSFTLYQGLSFVIFSHSTPAQQQAAWNFIKFFDSPVGQAIWAVQGGEPPISRADVSAVAKAAGPAFWRNPGPYNGTAVALHELENGNVIHKILGPNQIAVDGVIQTQIQEVIQHKESLSQALKNMETQGTSFLKGLAI